MLVPFFWVRSAGFPFDPIAQLALQPMNQDAPASADEAVFRDGAIHARRSIVQFFSDPLALEALFLSNPESHERVAALQAADLVQLNSRTRQRLRLAWSYLQRFCAKNDTCSFFGPIAWGRVDATSPLALRVDPTDPQSGWLRRRHVHIEHWVIEQLCDAINADPELRQAMPLRPNPGCDLDGDVLRYPVGKRARLGPEAAEFMRTALGGTHETRAPVAAGVERLMSARLVRHELSVPPGVEQPLGRVKAALASTRQAQGNASPLADGVSALENMRAHFADADLAKRRELLCRMTEALAGAGIQTERPRGTMYVGRLPIYEDCERNISTHIGAPLAHALEAHLAPVMRLFRVVAECVAARLHRHYARVLTTLPTDADGYADFLKFLQAARDGDGNRAWHDVVAAVRVVLADAWMRLAERDRGGEIALSRDALAAIADRLREDTPEHHRFAGVLGVHIASPDLMFAARSIEAIQAGDFLIILGEVHPCVLTALQPVALPFLESKADALALADALLAPGRILLATAGREYHRSQIDWPCVPNLYEVVLPGTASRCPPERQIPAGRGRVIGDGEVIRFVDRLTRRTDDIVTVLSSDLHRAMFALATDVLGGSLHSRLVYENVVLKRRSWSFAAEQLPAASHPAEDFAEYLLFRRWARAHQLPRHVFFRTGAEPKPLYVDWDVPLAVDAFAKIARQSPRVAVSEMRPAPHELWLADARGRYCCELRTSFVV